MLNMTAGAYLQLGNTVKAIEFNEAALKVLPDTENDARTRVMNDLGYSYAEHYELSMPGAATKLNEALRLTRTAVTEARKAGAAELVLGMYVDSLGWVYYKLQNFEEAIANLSRAAHLAPDIKEIHVHLAQAYHAAGRKDDALVEIEKALRIDPAYDVALKQLKSWKGNIGIPGAIPEPPASGGTGIQRPETSIRSELPDA
jgi:tetratricopeptide (TPR) repeat protein